MAVTRPRTCTALAAAALTLGACASGAGVDRIATPRAQAAQASEAAMTADTAPVVVSAKHQNHHQYYDARVGRFYYYDSTNGYYYWESGERRD